MTDGFWIFLLPFNAFPSSTWSLHQNSSKCFKVSKGSCDLTQSSSSEEASQKKGSAAGILLQSRRAYHISNRGVTASECLLLSVFRIPEIPQSSRSKGTARTQIIRCSIVISLRGHGLLLEPLCGRVKRELSTVRGPRSEEKQLLGEYERSTTDRCWTSLNILTATHYSEDCVRIWLEDGRR